jgi:hypothetical protein
VKGRKDKGPGYGIPKVTIVQCFPEDINWLFPLEKSVPKIMNCLFGWYFGSWDQGRTT